MPLVMLRLQMLRLLTVLMATVVQQYGMFGMLCFRSRQCWTGFAAGVVWYGASVRGF